MKLYDSIVIISLLMVLHMLITICSNNVLSDENKLTLFLIYLIVGLAAACEWISYFLNGTTGKIIILHKLVVIVKLCIMSIFPVIYANMILESLRDVEGLNRNKKFINIILVAHAIFEIISSKYGWVFYIDKYGYKQYGKIYVLYILICINSILYFFRAFFMFNKYFQNKNFVTLIGILIIGTVGATIQYVNPELKVKWLSIINASILVYMCYNETAMYVDDLTELLNKGAYQKKLKNIKKTVIILMFDVDSFKDINNEYGHVFGDEVLSIIGRNIKDTYGTYGKCYRIGGDEFFVILEKECDYEKLNNKFILKIEEARIEEANKPKPRNIPYVSIGCTRFDPKIQDALEAIEIADKDMYYRKERLKKKRKEQKM